MARGRALRRKLFPLWGSEPPSWTGAPGPRSERRGRWAPHSGGGVVHRSRRRQGRSGRPQRRRQDQPAQGARRRGSPTPAAPCVRQGALGLPAPGPPPAGRRASTPPPCPTSCPAAGWTRRPAAWRSCAWPWRRTPPNATWAASPGPRTPSRADGGYAAEAEVRRICAGLGSGARPGRPSPDRALRRRTPPGRAGPHPVRRQSDVLLLDEPTNHLDVDAKTLADGLPARLPRRAAGRQPRPRPARRGHHPGPAPRRGRNCIEYKGTYSQYLVARAADEERLAKLAERQQAEIHRLSTLADSMRHSDGQAGPDRQDASTSGSPACRRRGRDRPGQERRSTASGSRRRRTPAGWCSRRSGWPRATAGRPCSRTSASTVGAGRGVC